METYLVVFSCVGSGLFLSIHNCRNVIGGLRKFSILRSPQIDNCSNRVTRTAMCRDLFSRDHSRDYVRDGHGCRFERPHGTVQVLRLPPEVDILARIMMRSHFRYIPRLAIGMFTKGLIAFKVR